MAIFLNAPTQAGSRDQARDLLRSLNADLSGEVVTLDCSELVVGTPSFLDEVVKLVLEEGSAESLEILEATPRAQQLVERAAENRAVRARLRVAARSAS